MTTASLPGNTGLSPEYVTVLENRIAQLESQVWKFETQISRQQSSVSAMEFRLPNTNLISPNFLTRAFAARGI